MARVAFARHLYRFFPALEGREIRVKAATVAQAVAELERQFPGLAFYLVDEQGKLRQHVNIFIEEELVVDRERLSDSIQPETRLYVMQALSGG
ncbi:MAG: MoaD/ThiS family protein [Planctomycetaceae bacterium]|nr:hypothetical protein [Planctomycetota bacterium]NUO15412.1 MoaD/ThiS family protein [Planctomycetaceae bacterium]HRJ77059.1 MoaD/ThiS family protein [Planctomycetota bacterium]